MSAEALSGVVITFVALLFSLTVHEASHAAVAYLCGDDTSRLQGRLTLNPLAHIDPLGTIVLPLVMMMMSGFVFGWAKPVPFNPSNLKDVRRDPVLIAVAGPFSNLLLALLFTFVARIYFMMAGGIEAASPLLLHFFYVMVFLNLILVIFNLIPVPPLDGHYVLNLFLPPEGRRIMQQIGPFGILIALLLAMPIFRVAVPKIETFIFHAFGVAV